MFLLIYYCLFVSADMEYYIVDAHFPYFYI